MKKVALITGGARGIGKKIVEELSNEGYIVVVNYNSSVERAKSFEKDLVKAKRDCLFVKSDVPFVIQSPPSVVEDILVKTTLFVIASISAFIPIPEFVIRSQTSETVCPDKMVIFWVSVILPFLSVKET